MSSPITSTYAQIKQYQFKFNKLFTSFLKDRYVASITPSSSYTIKGICKQIDFAESKKFIELGAGNGVITEALIERSQSNAEILAFETCSELINELHENCHNKKLKILNLSAENIKAISDIRQFKADVVISGIPFSMFSQNLAQQIIEDIHASMKSDGTLIIYQAWIPPFWTTKKLRKILQTHFDEVATENVLFNVPPLKIITCRPK